MSSLKSLLFLSYRNLQRNRRRTFTILLTIALGTGSLFILDGFNAGIMNQYRDNTIRARYGNGQVNTQGYRDQVFEEPWEHWMKQPQPVINFLKSLPEVTHVFPRVEFYGLLTNGEITLSGRGQGIVGESEAEFFTTLNIEEGETLSDQLDGILLGKGLARSLKAQPGDVITVLGNTIDGTINGLDLTVTGIFHTGAKEFDDVVFRVPLEQAQILLETDSVESIALGLHSVKDWSSVAQAVTQEFPQLEATPFEVLDKVYYQHAVDWLGSQFDVILLIIILIVVLGIFNTISTSILERKQEVGNLRANGDSSQEVRLLFLCEGLWLGLFGAAFGIVLVYLLNITILSQGILMPPSPGITRQFHVFVELQPLGALMTFVLGVTSTLIGTWLASLKVTRLPIGEALRAV